MVHTRVIFIPISVIYFTTLMMMDIFMMMIIIILMIRIIFMKILMIRDAEHPFSFHPAAFASYQNSLKVKKKKVPAIKIYQIMMKQL